MYMRNQYLSGFQERKNGLWEWNLLPTVGLAFSRVPWQGYPRDLQPVPLLLGHVQSSYWIFWMQPLCPARQGHSREGVLAVCGFLFWCSSCGNSTPDLLWANFVSPLGCSQGELSIKTPGAPPFKGWSHGHPRFCNLCPFLSTLNLVFQPNFLYPEIPHKLLIKSIPL